MRDAHILRALFSEPWAILPEKFTALQEVALRHARSESLPSDAIAAITAAAEARAAAAQPAVNTGGSVAVINLFGVMAQRAGMLEEMSGAVSTEQVAQRFKAALADATVGSIVLNIDSPGGSVYGTAELADLVYSARGRKPVVAVANALAASAAYYVASQAEEVIVTPSGEVGSIGVWAAHVDMSRAVDAEGVTVTLISAGKYKVEGNPYEPLAGEARDYMQSRVDDYYQAFVKAVARGRDVKPADVAGGFGEGRVVGASEAVKLGMADRVDTLDNTISRLQSGKGRPGARAEDEQPAINAEADRDLRARRLRLAAHG